jgi:hypothetical protein
VEESRKNLMPSSTLPQKQDAGTKEINMHIRLDKHRRFALSSRLCEQADIRPGDCFLLSQQGNQIVLTPLKDAAERMREEFRAMLGSSVNLMNDLHEMRSSDAEDESR